MKKNLKDRIRYAVWIDHKKAIIVNVDERGIAMSDAVISEIEPRVRFKGEGSTKTRLMDTTLDSGKQKQGHDSELIHRYMKQVLQHIPSSAYFLLIAGPAETKYELHRAISKKKSMMHIPVEIKTTKKMIADEIADLLKSRVAKFESVA